ncbi:hypothetical protein GCM10009735_63450 [Actinomadura chokoriensis]
MFCGSLIHEDGALWNTALCFSPSGRRWTYKKINLAMNERGLLAAGDHLPTLEVGGGDVPFTVGVQICREIRFPELWQCLAEAGVQVFVYLTHAADPGSRREFGEATSGGGGTLSHFSAVRLSRLPGVRGCPGRGWR